MRQGPGGTAVAVLVIAFAAWSGVDGVAQPPPAPSFWDETRRGTNFFNRHDTADRFVAAAQAGVSFVRLTPSKWRAARRDVLVGDADHFTDIPGPDLETLRAQLDAAHRAGLKVVLTTLTLPGARWRQHNGDRSDVRLWTDFAYHAQSAAFWRGLATALRDHPAIVGYNLVNEPHPELKDGPIDEAAFDFGSWARRVAGTPADLDAFHATVVRAIREVDPRTPIIVDSGLYASPRALAALRPVDAPHVLYAFHIYEPYVMTTMRQNKGRYGYPDRIDGVAWDRAALERYLAPVEVWQRQHAIPSNRILVGEFGCDRRVRGADSYLADLVDIFEDRGWHWAFYAFREDTWDGMDYELGGGPTPGGFWAAVEADRMPTVRRTPSLAWDVLRRGLARGAR